MYLYQALEHIAESATSIKVSDSKNLWETFVDELKAHDSIGSEYVQTMQHLINKLLDSLNDNDKFSLWKETESGFMSEGDINNYSIDWITMGLQEELLDEILNYACKY